MRMGWLSRSKAPNVDDLIVRRRYTEALDLLHAELKDHARNERLRLQSAHVLALAGRKHEAVTALEALARDLAEAGFYTKAIAALKKAQTLEPGRSGVDEQLAALIQGGAPRATLPWVDSGPRPEASLRIGVEAEEPESAPFTPANQPPPAREEDEEIEIELPPSGAGERDAAGRGEVAPPDEAPAPEPRIVETPLFGSLSRDEALAVIRGLRLQSFGPGHILVTEGEPGGSLWVLTSGVCRAWLRDGRGHSVEVRKLREGDFFGEIAVLTEKPRTATVTTATACELLELDRETLAAITAAHPRVHEVLEEFHARRAGSRLESAIRNAGTS